MSASERSDRKRSAQRAEPGARALPERDPVIDDARRLHLVLLRRIKLLTARSTTKPFAVSLISLARSIERELQREAELCVEEVRTEATIDALAEQIDEMRVMGGIQEMQLGRLAEKSGHLRAERARIEARLSAERAAAAKTQQLLEIRLRAAGVARADTL
jgi:hypothetical protein